MGDVDVAVPDADRLELRGGAEFQTGPLVEEPDLLRGVHVVENQHLLRPDDHHLALLVRIQPGNVDLGDPAVGKVEVRENDVLDSLLQKARAAGRDTIRLFTKKVQDDRDIVSRQGPEGVLVLADDSQVQTRAVRVVDLAQLAAHHLVFHHGYRRMVFKQVPDHQLTPLPVSYFHQLFSVFHGQCDRLFHKHMLVCQQGQLGQFVVAGRRGRQRHGVDARIIEDHLIVGRGRSLRVERAESLQEMRSAVADVGEVGVRSARETTDHVLAPLAQADDGQLDDGIAHTDFLSRICWRC